MSDKKECGNCAYGATSENELRCHLHPPVVVQVTIDTTPHWKRPPVKADDFCGSWAKK